MMQHQHQQQTDDAASFETSFAKYLWFSFDIDEYINSKTNDINTGMDLTSS